MAFLPPSRSLVFCAARWHVVGRYARRSANGVPVPSSALSKRLLRQLYQLQAAYRYLLLLYPHLLPSFFFFLSLLLSLLPLFFFNFSAFSLPLFSLFHLFLLFLYLFFYPLSFSFSLLLRQTSPLLQGPSLVARTPQTAHLLRTRRSHSSQRANLAADRVNSSLNYRYSYTVRLRSHRQGLLPSHLWHPRFYHLAVYTSASLYFSPSLRLTLKKLQKVLLNHSLALFLTKLKNSGFSQSRSSLSMSTFCNWLTYISNFLKLMGKGVVTYGGSHYPERATVCR